MDLLTLDDLAELSEEQAVRSRLESHNLRMLRRFLTWFILVAAIEVAVSLQRPLGGTEGGELKWGGVLEPVTAALNLVLALVLLAACRRAAGSGKGQLRWLEPLARKIARRVNATVIAVLLGQFALLAVYGSRNSGGEAWYILFPFLIVFFRLTVVELLLVHGAIVLSVLASVLLVRWLTFDTDVLPVGAMTNAISWVLGVWLTRRLKNDLRRQWRDARERHQDQLRMRQELDYAREIQLSMLPLANPEVDWLDIASLSLPATEVGGDYYDYFPIDADRLAVVAGDVAGHGFAAGLLLASVRGCLTLLVGDMEAPQTVMSKLNHMVKKTTRRRMLVSLAVLSLDRSRGRATLTSAAYPPVLIRRADGSVEELATSSLPLGALLAEKFAYRDVPFAAGDVFLLYTDGVYETVDESGEMYGLDRLSESLAAQDSGTAEEIRAAILKDLWAFKGRAVQADDVTFVVLKVR